MSVDVKTPNSPGWWLAKAAKKLAARQPRLEMLAGYHDGNPPLPIGAEAARPAYQAFQKASRTNFAELIVGATRERCSVRAIRTAVEQDSNGDDAAWEIWKDNDLSVEFSDVLENMLALGDGYMLIGLDPDDPERVAITGEDPRQMVTIHNPLRQSEVRAALKLFHDADAGKDYAFLFVQGDYILDEDGARTQEREQARRYVASRDRKTKTTTMAFSASAFSWDEDFGGEEGESVGHQFVPVVRFRNRRGIGEFETHVDVLDRINHEILQRMVIALYQAYKIRAIQVDEEDMPDEDETTGSQIDYEDILTADPGSFLKIPANAKIWESGQADMSGIRDAIKDDVQHLMAVTRTPLSATDAINQSAEGASLIKEGQIFKTEDKQRRAESALIQVLSIAFLCLGDTERSDKRKLSIDWAPAERFSLQQKYSAGSQAPAAGVPTETIWTEVLQFSPDTVELAKAQQMDDAIRKVVTGGPTDPGTAAGQPARVPADGGTGPVNGQ